MLTVDPASLTETYSRGDNNPSLVKPALARVSSSALDVVWRKLVSFGTRFAFSEGGLAASNYVAEYLTAAAKPLGSRVTVEQFKHKFRDVTNYGTRGSHDGRTDGLTARTSNPRIHACHFVPVMHARRVGSPRATHGRAHGTRPLRSFSLTIDPLPLLHDACASIPYTAGASSKNTTRSRP